MQIIKNREIVDDSWQRLLPEEDVDVQDLPLEGDPLLVNLAVWQARRDELIASDKSLGLWLAADDQLDAVDDGDFSHFELIALDLPHFKDGRAFSKARLLREQFGFEGELRAVGDVQYDQLFFLSRVGFNAFELAPGFDLQEALEGFEKYSVAYQPGTDIKKPLFRRVRR